VRALSAAEVLGLWERAERLSPVERALAMAAAADHADPDSTDGRDAAALAALPLGTRDRLLLRLRAATFGSSLTAYASCPGCGERVEFTADADAIAGLAADPPPPVPVEASGCRVTWRPPDSRDLMAAARQPDPAAAERTLLARCVVTASDAARPVEPTSLPEAVRAALAAAMATADPLAEVLVDVACPACGTGFVSDLDVAGFVWAELRARAQRLLADVDTLARAYGWREPDVLALGDPRREAYLRLATGVAP
jgi:hypothetical protein